jgi:hypothetical protein
MKIKKSHIVLIGIFLTVILLQLVRCTAGEINQPTGKLKCYVNLAIPGGAKFSPVVLSATEDSTVVARVFYVDKNRDIQVLQRKCDAWEFVGPQGMALTGVDGNFLSGAVEGPDGRLWVLADYSKPSNPVRAEHIFLYCYEDGNWKIKGPKDGYHSGMMENKGLYFLGGNEPVMLSYDYDPDRKQDIANLVSLKEEEWASLPVQDFIRAHVNKVLWQNKVLWRNNTDAWMFDRSKINPDILQVFQICGPKNEDIHGPWNLGVLKQNTSVLGVAISGERKIALVFIADEKEFAHLYIPVTKESYQVSELPFQFNHLQTIEWSPKGVLWAVDSLDSHHLQVFRLNDRIWEKRYEATQPAGDGSIGDVRMFFRLDGEPIVVWENLFIM